MEFSVQVDGLDLGEGLYIWGRQNMWVQIQNHIVNLVMGELISCSLLASVFLVESSAGCQEGGKNV